LRRRLTTAAGLLLGLAAAWLALRGLEKDSLGAVLTAIGPAVAFVFLPQALSFGLDSVALDFLLRRQGYPAALARVGRCRVAVEFLAVALPAGAVVADGTLPVLLSRWAGVRSPDGVASVAARKLMIWRAHAGCLLLAGTLAALGFGSDLTHKRSTVILLFAAGLLVAVLSALLALLAGSARPASRVRGLLLRIPLARLREALAEAEAHFHDTDARLAKATRMRAVRVHLLYLSAWLARVLEPFVILRLAGAPLSFVDVLAAESLVGVARSAMVVVPAGLGVQELGWAMFLRAAGVPDPTALTGALALLRRLREAFWAAAGYVLLMKRPGERDPLEPELAAAGD
jgi:glycosyltransferase 2 family protein